MTEDEYLKNKYEQKWEEHFELLLKFKNEFGRCPKDTESYQGFALGKWCSGQKQYIKKGDYPQNRYDRLKQIGLFDTSHKTVWEQHYQELLMFLETYERFPRNSEEFNGFNLGAWCSVQKRKAKSDSYPAYRKEKLMKIGFFEKRLNTLSWDDSYRLLQEYVSEYHRFPSAKETYKGYTIGEWCNKHKSRSKNPNYPKDKLKKLQEIGLFNSTYAANWERHYQLVLEFIAEYGRLPKQKESYKGERIGLWCTTQKQRHTKSTYPEEHKQKLRQIGLIQ